MRFMEFGKEHGRAIMLLHGGGLSWWNYREPAEILSAEYRVIVPVLDGHAGSDAEFTSIGDNAGEIIRFIDESLGGKVLLIGGLSLGGQILAEILSRRADICRYALIESALVVPSKLTHSLIRPVFGSCYGLIRRRWFARLQFRSLRIQPSLFEEYYRDTCLISRDSMIAFLQANSLYSVRPSLGGCTAKAHIFVGGKESRAMRRSAVLLHESLPGSVLQVLPGLRHGEFSLNHASRYADAIRRITG